MLPFVNLLFLFLLLTLISHSSFKGHSLASSLASLRLGSLLSQWPLTGQAQTQRASFLQPCFGVPYYYYCINCNSEKTKTTTTSTLVSNLILISIAALKIIRKIQTRYKESFCKKNHQVNLNLYFSICYTLAVSQAILPGVNHGANDYAPFFHIAIFAP